MIKSDQEMIVEIETPRPTCREALDYNEGKVLRGVAELVGYANMESPGREAVYSLFERYERSRYAIREMSFHASVNPSAEDGCSQDEVLSFISGLMAHLGYARQPFLVYRHFDIEREHYHIVSIRIDRNKRKINNYYEKRRASAYMREVAARFGFSVAEKGSRVSLSGDLSTESAESRDILPRFNPRGPVLGQFVRLYGAALEYDHEGPSQLSCILEDMGVRCAKTEQDGAPAFILQGLDRKGNPVTEPFSEKEVGEPLYAMAASSWDRSRTTRGRRAREKERVRSLVGFAFDISRSEGHFVNILRKKGIAVHFSRTPDTGEVFGITLVDHATRSVFKASDLRDVLSVGKMRQAVSSGKWRAEERGHSYSLYVKAVRATAHSDAVRLRDLRAGVVARLLRPVGQPVGASWNGRPRKDRDQREAELDAGRTGGLSASFVDHRFEDRLD